MTDMEKALDAVVSEMARLLIQCNPDGLRKLKHVVGRLNEQRGLARKSAKRRLAGASR